MSTRFRAIALADLPALAAFVDTACDAFGADGEVRFSVRLAVEEVFRHILRRGYGGTGPVLVEVDGGPRSVRVRLKDEAPAPERLDGAAQDLEAVRRLIDTFEHAPAAPRGNVYTLVKQFPA